MKKALLIALLLLVCSASVASADTDTNPPVHPGPLHFRGYICHPQGEWDDDLDLSDGGCWGNGMRPYPSPHTLEFWVEGELVESKQIRESDGFYNFRLEGPIPPRYNIYIRFETVDDVWVAVLQTDGYIKFGNKFLVRWDWPHWCCVEEPVWPWLGLEIKHVSWANWVAYEIAKTVTPTPTNTHTPTPTNTPTPTLTPTQIATATTIQTYYFPLYLRRN